MSLVCKRFLFSKRSARSLVPRGHRLCCFLWAFRFAGKRVAGWRGVDSCPCVGKRGWAGAKAFFPFCGALARAGLLFCPFFVFAEAAGGAFPFREIFFQLFNFSLFSAGLIFLLRKPVQVFFHKRQEEFIAFEKQALKLEKEKRAEYEKWEKKREEAEENSSTVRQKAREEGERFAFQQKEVLKNLKIRLQKSSDFVIHREREKAKRDMLAKWEGRLIRNARLGLELETRRPDFHSAQVRHFCRRVESHTGRAFENR